MSDRTVSVLRTHDDRVVPGDERVRFSAATEVNREDFGLTWNMALETGGLLVGKTARIELSVQAIASTAAAAA